MARALGLSDLELAQLVYSHLLEPEPRVPRAVAEYAATALRDRLADRAERTARIREQLEDELRATGALPPEDRV